MRRFTLISVTALLFSLLSSGFAEEGSSVRGGGGTLLFSFRRSASAAKTLMENTPLLSGEGIDAAITRFYAEHRLAWIAALQKLSTEAGAVIEVDEELHEYGRKLGARVVPMDDPQRVELSVPYLTTRDGFPESKSFALAVHEAGHFAKPFLMELEHGYLDIISMLLYQKRSSLNSSTTGLPKESLHFSFKHSINKASVMSDGRTVLVQIEREGDYLIDLETGLKQKMSEAVRILSGDLILVSRAEGKGHYIQNLVTGENRDLLFSDPFYSVTLLSDGQTLMGFNGLREMFYYDLFSSKIERFKHLRSGPFGNVYSADGRLEAQQVRGQVVIYDIRNDLTVDFFGKPGTPFNTIFSPDNRWIASVFYRDGVFTTYLHDLLNKTEVSYNGYYTEAFSEDGAVILFITSSGIGTANVFTGEVRLLSTPAPPLHVEFVKGNENLVFIELNDEKRTILIRDRTTGKDVQVVQSIQGVKMSLQTVRTFDGTLLMIANLSVGEMWLHRIQR